MAAIHENFVELMDKLVRKNGRAISIRRQTGTTLKDPANPHLGSTIETTDTPTKGVFLDNDSRDLLLMLPGQPDQRTVLDREIDRLLMIPGKGLNFELDIEATIVDGSKLWQITQVNKIQPGPTLVGYFVRISN